jgi:serine/threonine protein kinase
MPTCDRDRLGRYEALTELGRGAMGTVYKARDPKIDRLVAIKTISVSDSANNSTGDFRERFFREARAAGRLSHPGIVTIYDVEEDSSGPYIVMEYVAGRTLEQLLSGETKYFAPATALDLAEQLGQALHYAHRQGIVHRDIKPANIIVTPDGRAKITDFGIAKLDLSQFTATGQVFGTPSYMSPEQIEGEEVDARSDLFSLGVVLYSMLTGYRPFQGNGAATISYKLVYKEPVPVTALNAALPVHCDYVVSRALAKSPAHRYQSGQEMAFDLQDIKAGVPPRSQSANSQPATAQQTRVQFAVAKDSIWKRHVIRPRRSSVLGQGYSIIRKKTVWLTSLAIVMALSAGALYRTHRLSELAGRDAVPVTNAEASSGLPPNPPTPVAQAGMAAPVGSSAPVGSKTVSRPSHEASTKSPVEISVQTPFESATLTVWVDDKVTYQHVLEGQTKKKLWVVKNVVGDLSGTMLVPAGKHLLRVQISSERDHYFGASRVEGNFAPHEAQTLSVIIHGHDRQMTASLQ